MIIIIISKTSLYEKAVRRKSLFKETHKKSHLNCATAYLGDTAEMCISLVSILAIFFNMQRNGSQHLKTNLLHLLNSVLLKINSLIPSKKYYVTPVPSLLQTVCIEVKHSSYRGIPFPFYSSSLTNLLKAFHLLWLLIGDPCDIKCVMISKEGSNTYLDLQWGGLVVHGHTLSFSVRCRLQSRGRCWVLGKEETTTQCRKLASNTNTHVNSWCCLNLSVQNPVFKKC